MRRKLFVGNWKMNGNVVANAVLLAGIKAELGRPACDVAVCVPAPYFSQCQVELADTAVAWGGQDISSHGAGAYTGEVAAAMLHDFGCSYVIVGHSERRTYHGEHDLLVAQKAVRALESGLIPIVCVGETLSEREAGQTNAVIVRQVNVILEALDASDLEKIVIAYEPVWAIGTGKTATPQMAQDAQAVIRAQCAGRDSAAAAKIRILYGGSMKPDNAKALLSMPDIDGGLVGGASLNAKDFLAIVGAAFL